MMRLIALAVLLSLVCRWVFGKWPWDYLKPPQTRAHALAQARTLLGVGEGASAREIRDAHRRMAALVHPDRGGNTADLQEINAARDLLLTNLPPESPEPPR